MKSYAFALDLKDDPEVIRTYEKYHREVWPEVIAALKAVGIIRMRIYRTGNRLFMFTEAADTFDPARDFPRYVEQSPRAREWDELMRQYQQKLASAGPDDWWAPMSLAFDSEWS